MAILTIKMVHTVELSPELSAQLDRLIEALGPEPDVTALKAKLEQLEGKTGELSSAVERNTP